MNKGMNMNNQMNEYNVAINQGFAKTRLHFKSEMEYIFGSLVNFCC